MLGWVDFKDPRGALDPEGGERVSHRKDRLKVES